MLNKKHKIWNKGLHIQTNTGRTHFKKGNPGYWLGKKRPSPSQEIRIKISNALKKIKNRKTALFFYCQVCNKKIPNPDSRKLIQFCSMRCYIFKRKISNLTDASFKQREYHWNWKGGKIFSGGYLYIYKPEHLFCNHHKYIKNSRLIMEQYLGRYLNPKEVVHHINNIKTDDRIENLKLFRNKSEHRKYHSKIKSIGHNYKLFSNPTIN